MTNSETTGKKIHQGKNIKRFREMLGIKQEAFAQELGEEWTQRRVSLLEGKEVVEPEVLELVARVLKVPIDALKNLDEEGVLNIIGNTFNDNSVNNSSVNGNYNFNPIEKIVELYESKIELYERMLQDKNETIIRLEQLLKSKA